MTQISLGSFANFNSAIPWGLWVAIYIWLVGISAGTFLLVMWGNLKDRAPLKEVTRLGIILAISTLSAGLLSILIDLGHIERFYKLFLSPSPVSAMAWMVWLYNLYFCVLAFSLYRLKKGLTKPLLISSLVFALAVIIIESLLFAMPPGRHWHSPIFIAHFLTSSVASAIAALICGAAVFGNKEKKSGLLEGLGALALPIVGLNLCVEVIDIVFLGGAGHVEGWMLMLVAIAVIALLLKRTPRAIIAAGAIELIRILASKYNILVSAQAIEPYKGFGAAFIENRLQFNYAPTVFEFLVSIFLVCLAASIFYFLYKIFPLTREE